MLEGRNREPNEAKTGASHIRMARMPQIMIKIAPAGVESVQFGLRIENIQAFQLPEHTEMDIHFTERKRIRASKWFSGLQP